jgi:AcrR family transcriptional regulator
VYSNFTSKGDLFFALVDRQVTQRVTVVHQLVDDALEPSAKTARRVGARLTETIRANADFQILFFEYWLRANRDPAVRERFAEHRHAIREQFARQFDAMGHLLPNGLSAAELAQLVLSLSNGIAIEEITEPGSTPPNLIGKVLAQLIEPGAK